MINRVVLSGYRRFRHAQVDLQPGMNLVVGNNEAGKSSLLEGIVAALTGRIRGVGPREHLPSTLLHRGLVGEWLDALQCSDSSLPFPAAFIELYMDEADVPADYMGTNNSRHEDAPGVRLDIKFDDRFQEAAADILAEVRAGGPFPIDYYALEWTSFAGLPLHPRTAPVSGHLIDATRIRLNSGSDYFIRGVIDSTLDDRQQRALSSQFTKMKRELIETDQLKQVNDELQATAATVTHKSLSLQAAEDAGSSWDLAVQPHLDSLPFSSTGTGEASRLKILLALSRRADSGHVFLIEEPENHLSFSSLNELLAQISNLVPDRQVVVATHSSFVTNRLGVENVALINGDRSTTLDSLPPETAQYFRKLSGYDTLRVLLCKAAFLVEGPSDDLVLQRFFRDQFGELPLRMGYDVIECRGLAFRRILDIAAPVERRVAVVTDNDGVPERKREAYSELEGAYARVFLDGDASLRTLEPQIVAANSLETINAALRRDFEKKDQAIDWMLANKTEAAVRIFDAEVALNPPTYMREALTWLVA